MLRPNAPILQKTAKRNIVWHAAKLSNILDLCKTGIFKEQNNSFITFLSLKLTPIFSKTLLTALTQSMKTNTIFIFIFLGKNTFHILKLCHASSALWSVLLYHNSWSKLNKLKFGLPDVTFMHNDYFWAIVLSLLKAHQRFFKNEQEEKE